MTAPSKNSAFLYSAKGAGPGSRRRSKTTDVPLFLQDRSGKNVIILDIGSHSKGFRAENFKPQFGVKCICPVVFLPAAQPD
jgi:hypothetical protein